MVASSSYEECRRQRLEENRKRMEELNLLKLSKSLAAAAANPKPSLAKHLKPKSAPKAVDLSAVRRSTRVADKPMPNYNEGLIEPLERRVPYSYRRRDLLNRVYASDDGRMYAIERAERLESELGSEFPIFVKPMLQSNVTSGFWLGVPYRFCSSHMPKEDEMITLEDEEGNESLSKYKYLADRTGLSGGWRDFALDHELVDGDALVFQLVKPTKFKVYIIRVNEHENEDGGADVNGDGDMDSDVVPIDTVPVTEPEEVSEPSPGTRRSKRKKSSRK